MSRPMEVTWIRSGVGIIRHHAIGLRDGGKKGISETLERDSWARLEGGNMAEAAGTRHHVTHIIYGSATRFDSSPANAAPAPALFKTNIFD